MPVKEVVSDIREREERLRETGDEPPEEDGRGEIREVYESSLENIRGLPPYLHHDKLRENGSLFLVGTLVGLLWFIEAKQSLLKVRV